MISSRKIFAFVFTSFIVLGLMCLHFLGQGNIIYFKRLALQALTLKTTVKHSQPNFTNALQFRALKKALLYNELAKTNFLQKGMIINRDRNGNAIDVCDSLLFSALRMTALRKLGLTTDAQTAYDNIKKVIKKGVIKRHQDCYSFPSRDMFVGALIALHYKQADSKAILEELIQHLETHNGYFGEGPLFVSYLTPNLGLLLRLVAINQGIDLNYKSLPLKYSVGAPELTSLLIEPGYEAHLLALSLWLEMELIEHLNTEGQILKDRSPILKMMSSLLDAKQQKENLPIRWAWLGQQLLRIDSKNLFFKFLYYKSMDALSDARKIELLGELMQMNRAFPDDQLPTSCNRKADYMWQRSSREYVSDDASCNYLFSGTDWLWMVSLLLEDSDGATIPTSEQDIY